MKAVLALFLFLSAGSISGQAADPAQRYIEHFKVDARSRLVALAAIGANVRISLLVEAGDLAFLQQSITLERDRETASELIQAVLSGPEEYAVARRGRLYILSLTRPEKPLKSPVNDFTRPVRICWEIDLLARSLLRLSHTRSYWL